MGAHIRVACFRAEKDYHDLHWLGEILNNNSSVAPFIPFIATSLGGRRINAIRSILIRT